MSRIHLSSEVSFPLSFVTNATAVLARRGAGKSYTASVIAEQVMDAEQPVIILDPLGAFWGLRSSADGKKAGYSMIILGGRHGDVPLEPTAGKVIGNLVAEKPGCYIIDLSLFESNASQDRFATDFLETLYRVKASHPTAQLLIVDEADSFAPQRPGPNQLHLLGAMEAIVRRGRSRGLGMVMISQRAAVLNKNILTQAENLIIMQTTGPQDRDAIEAWIEGNGTKQERAVVLESLASLSVGECWVWSPQYQMLEKAKVQKRKTFDSSATPKPGETRMEPTKKSEVDLAQLGNEIKATVERAEANDPAKLKAEIHKLKAELAKKPEAKVEQVQVPILDKQTISLLEDCKKWISEIHERVGGVTKLLGSIDQRITETVVQKFPKLPAPAPKYVSAPRAPVVVKGTTIADISLPSCSGGIRRMMIAMAQRPGLNKRQLGLRAGLSSSSGTFGTYLAKMRTSGWISDSGQGFQLTDAGQKALGNYEPLPMGADLQRYWLAELGSSGGARMLQVLINSYPGGVSRETLGQASSISHTSGTFGTYLSKLRTLELVVANNGELKASDELFD